MAKFKLHLLYSVGTNWGIILGGVALRLKHYFEGRSLWLDEAYLALNLMDSSFQQLLMQAPIIQEQAKAPLFFSLAVKGVIQLCGSSEMVLRLVPLVAGIVAIPLFYRLIRHVLSPPFVTVALGLFALCEPLIYYSAELKPYSTDVMITLLLLLCFRRVWEDPDERSQYIRLALVGWAAIWSSFPGIMVLAGIGLVLIFRSPVKERNFFALIGTFWAVNVLLVYKYAVQPMLASTYITGSIAEHFLTAPLWTPAGLRWMMRAWGGMFWYLLGQPFFWVPMILFVLGAYSFWTSRREVVMVLVLPLLLAFIAACWGKYPFFQRHLLFLIPALIILVAQGFACVGQLWPPGRWWLGGVVLVILFGAPTKTAAVNLVRERESEQNRQVMLQLTKSYQRGQRIYLNTSAQYMFVYYLDRLDRESEFLEPLPVVPNERYQGILIGKIGDQLNFDEAQGHAEFSNEIFVYDMAGKMIGKTYIAGKGLGQIQDWRRLQEDTIASTEINWLVLSHTSVALRENIVSALKVQADIIHAHEGRDAALYQFRLKTSKSSY